MSNSNSPLEGLTYFIHAFGCQMNKHDSERVAGMLDSKGCFQVNKIEDSDIVVLLTCCVREAADSRMFGQLESMKNVPLRQGTPLKKRIFVIGGCIAQRDGESLLEKYDFIDVVIGTQVLSKLTSLLEDCIVEGKRGYSTPEASDEFASDLPSKREHSWAAWLPITSGCNNFCTYCIVPYVRGREKSRPIEDIVSEAEDLVKKGVQEITLLGQNVNSYGRDLYGEPRFYDILKAVSETGVPRFRFLTSHPKDLKDEVIGLFGELENLAPSLHLPVQCGSDKVLHDMNRKYTFAQYLELIKKLKAVRPDIAISTDIIVGFPTETKEDFEQTLKIVDEVKYASAFTFIYSKRKGTPAAKMIPCSTTEEIHERYEMLTDRVAVWAHEFNQQFANKTVKALVEGTSKKDSNILRGISAHSQVVHAPIETGKTVNDYIGKIIDVKITDPKTWYLKGEINH